MKITIIIDDARLPAHFKDAEDLKRWVEARRMDEPPKLDWSNAWEQFNKFLIQEIPITPCQPKSK